MTTSRASLPIPAGKSIKCRCPACSDEPGPTFTEAHRLECEARYVAAMASNEKRAAYLADVAKIRGTAAAEQLRKAAWTVMQIQALDL